MVLEEGNMVRWLVHLKEKRGLLATAVIAVLALLDAVIATLLVYPNDFAPDGVQGVATILQALSGVSVGVFLLLINAPLLLFAFLKMKRMYAIRNLCYVLSFSLFSLICAALTETAWFGSLQFRAPNEEMLLLLAAAYGTFNGLVYATSILLGGATGGTDILAAIVTYYRREYSTVWVLFTIKATIAVSSYFVYGRRALPVIVSLTCSFLCTTVSDYILRGSATALKFEVITKNPRELSAELMRELGHGCTAIPSVGMYEGAERTLLLCLVNKRQRVDFELILEHYPDTFAYCYPVKSTYGYFDRIK